MSLLFPQHNTPQHPIASERLVTRVCVRSHSHRCLFSCCRCIVVGSRAQLSPRPVICFRCIMALRLSDIAFHFALISSVQSRARVFVGQCGVERRVSTLVFVAVVVWFAPRHVDIKNQSCVSDVAHCSHSTQQFLLRPTQGFLDLYPSSSHLAGLVMYCT